MKCDRIKLKEKGRKGWGMKFILCVIGLASYFFLKQAPSENIEQEELQIEREINQGWNNVFVGDEFIFKQANDVESKTILEMSSESSIVDKDGLNWILPDSPDQAILYLYTSDGQKWQAKWEKVEK